jgi:hypothetical protein
VAVTLTAVVGLGAAVTAVLAIATSGASAVAPIIVEAFGVGGAIALAPLQNHIHTLFVACVLALGLAFWQAYGPARLPAPAQEGPGAGLSIVRVAWWFAALVSTAALAYMLFLLDRPG